MVADNFKLIRYSECMVEISKALLVNKPSFLCISFILIV